MLSWIYTSYLSCPCWRWPRTRSTLQIDSCRLTGDPRGVESIKFQPEESLASKSEVCSRRNKKKERKKERKKEVWSRIRHMRTQAQPKWHAKSHLPNERAVITIFLAEWAVITWTQTPQVCSVCVCASFIRRPAALVTSRISAEYSLVSTAATATRLPTWPTAATG